MKERNTFNTYASLTLADKMVSTGCCVVGICFIYARASVRFPKTRKEERLSLNIFHTYPYMNIIMYLHFEIPHSMDA